MSLDEKIFQSLWRLAQKIQHVAKKDSLDLLDRTAELSSLTERLNLFAAAFSNHILEIRGVTSCGSCSPTSLYLPDKIGILPCITDNIDLYFYRVFHDITLVRLSVELNLIDPIAQHEPLFQALQVYFCLSRCDQELAQVAPKLYQRWQGVKSQLAGPKKMAPIETTGELLDHLFSDYFKENNHSLPMNCHKNIKMFLAENRFVELVDYIRLLNLKPNARFQDIPICWGGLHLDQSLIIADPGSVSERSLPNGTEKKAKAKDRVTRTTVPTDDDWNPVTHVLESVKTAEDYDGSNRMVDGSDELNQHLDALEDLSMDKVIRSADQVSSIYQSDLNICTTELQNSSDNMRGDLDYYYDEWDTKAKIYRNNWCHVVHTLSGSLSEEAKANALADAQKLLTKDRRIICDLQRKIASIVLSRRWRNRQVEGEEIDIDAAVERVSLIKTGITDSRRLYVRKRRHDRDIATLILMDASLSTDSWLQGFRILDLAKESALILAEVLSKFDLKVALSAFNSHTRKDCRFLQIKDFDAPWKSAIPGLMNLAPAGYTRIGPAIRHGSHLLSQTNARKKILLMIGDGKPTDYDAYEGLYGIDDVRHAITEAQSKNMRVYNITIGSSNKLHYSNMFGQHNFQIVNDVSRLPHILAGVYSKLI